MGLQDITSYEGEFQDFPVSWWEDGEFYAIRRLVVGWDDRITLQERLWTPPDDQYPYPEGPPGALTRKTRIDPMPKGAQTNAADAELTSYEKVIITAEYSTRGPRWVNNQLIEEWLEPTGEFHTVAFSKLAWVSEDLEVDGKPLDATEAPGRLVYGFDLVRKYHRLQELPTWVEDLVGCINSNPVDAPILGRTYAPYTLLYKTPVIRGARKVTSAAWNLTLRLGYHPWTWRKFWRADGGTDGTGDYEPQYAAGNGQYIHFPAVPFNFG